MLIDIHELATRLSVSESGIYQWVSQRKIPFVKLGRRLRFDPQQIDEWLADKAIPAKNI